MATQKPTALGYAEIAKRMGTAGDGTGSCVKKIVGLSGACTAAEASTFLNPGGATKLADNGFAIVDATTVKTSKTTVDDDTVEVNHVFTTKTASQKTTGFAIINADADVAFMEACYAAEIPTEVADTVTLVAKMQFKLGA